MTPFSDLDDVAPLWADFPCPWAFCGGWAINLFLGRVTRPHQDIDLAVLRRDQTELHSHLTRHRWIMHRVASGVPAPWLRGQRLELPVHEVWCTNPSDPARRMELLFNESTARDLVFRRDRRITLPLGRAIVQSRSGLPVLAPELVLLYKSTDPRERQRDDRDFRSALPALDERARHWFREALERLDPQNPWLPLVRRD